VINEAILADHAANSRTAFPQNDVKAKLLKPSGTTARWPLSVNLLSANDLCNGLTV